MTPNWHPSPNFGPRRGVVVPDMVVLHYTAMHSAEAARDWLCAEASQVSAHYVIAENGQIWHLVHEVHRAWHAGVGQWGGQKDINSHSVGIEIANSGDHPFPAPQMQALEVLLQGILTRWRIPPERVVGHSDTALGRKIDPGPRFDWCRLARQGLAVWPEARRPGRFADDIRRFGYDWTPEREDAVVEAFRMRFRPWATGPLAPMDCALAADLAARWPCRTVDDAGLT